MPWRPRLRALSTSVLVGAGALVGEAALATPAASLFAANAIGQTRLNTQLPGKPDDLLATVKASLAKQGCSERTVNTVVGPWGFNLVLDPPAGTKVDGTAEGKAAAPVLQATTIGPNQLNLNVRFEGL